MTIQIQNTTEWTDASIEAWVSHLLGNSRPWTVKATVHRAHDSYCADRVKRRNLGVVYIGAGAAVATIGLPARGAVKRLYTSLESLACIEDDHMAMPPALLRQLSAALLISRSSGRPAHNVNVDDPVWRKKNHVVAPTLPEQIPALFMRRAKLKLAPRPLDKRLAEAERRLDRLRNQMRGAEQKHQEQMNSYAAELLKRQALMDRLLKRTQGEG